MSLTLICLYIMFGMFVFMFFHYKFLKILEYCAAQPFLLLRKNTNSIKPVPAAVVATPIQRNNIWSIPGPKIIPFFGTKWLFFWQYKMSQIHQLYDDFHKWYGPIALEVTPGGIPIVHLYDRRDIEKVLRYPSKYPFRPPTDIISFYRNSRPDRYASVGITNEQGIQWQHLRSKLTPSITSPRILQAFMPSLNIICDDFIELLRLKRNSITGIVENFQDIANLMGLEAVCTLMIGRRMGFLSPNPPPEITALAVAVKKLFVTQRDSSYGFGLWRYLPTKTYRDFVQSEETIYNIVSEIVDRANEEEQIEFNDNDMRSVFLSILNQEDLDIREKKSAIIDFISAGIETLANTLSFILYYTTKLPEAKENIRNEFIDCDKNISPIQPEHLTKAIYTKACLNETYRICPTAFCLARILEEDTNLSGYDLKAGTVVLCQTMVACNDNANFIDAKQFQPNRWLNGRHQNDGNDTTGLVVPFGIGKRTCPGRRFVEMELTIVLAKLFSEFDITFCGELETEFEFLLVPKTPVNIILKDRVKNTI